MSAHFRRKNLVLIVIAGTILFLALILGALFLFSGNNDLTGCLRYIQVSDKVCETVNRKKLVLPDRPVVIPFHYGAEGTMLVPVQLGKRHVEFIFDTGSSVCTLWKESVPGDIMIQETKFLGTGYSYCFLPDTHLGEMFLGGITVKVSPRWCRDAQNCAGLLGGSLFSYFDVTIDYPAKQIILTKHISHKSTSRPAVIVPFQLKDKLLYVKLSLEGKKTVAAAIDTGCPFNSIDLTTLKSNVEDPKGNYVQLKNMRIGAVEFNSPIFEISDDLRPGIPPLIGNGTLSQYRPTIDYQDGKLILEPITSGTPIPLRTLSLGLYHLASKQFETAVAEFTNVLKTEPELGDFAYCGRARCFEALKDYKHATDDYSRLLINSPAWAYSSRGYMYQKQGMYQKSIDDFSKSISLRILPRKEIWPPGSDSPVKRKESNEFISWLFRSRAWNHEQLHEDRKALSDYTKSIEFGPADPSGYLARAWCYDGMGDVKEAIDDYGQAIRLDPKNTESLVHRARCREEFKDFKGAIDDYSSAIVLQPKTANYYFLRSCLFAKVGQKDLAANDRAMSKRLVQRRNLNPSSGLPAGG